MVSCCISPPFGRLSTTSGKVIYVVLTRAPLYRGLLPFSLDLHVLGAPLTFVLSQDQTLQLNFLEVTRCRLRQLMTAHALWHDVLRICLFRLHTRGHIIRTFCVSFMRPKQSQ